MTWSFGQASGPRTNPPDSNPYIHLQPHRPQFPSSSPQSFHRNTESPQSTYSPPSAFPSNYSAVGPSHPPAATVRSFDPRTHQRPSIATPSLPSKNQGANFPAATAPLDYLKRTRPYQLQSTNENLARNSRRRDTSGPSDMGFDGHLQSVSQRTSPPVLSGNTYSREVVRPFIEVQRQRPPGPLFDDDEQPVPQRMSSPPLFSGNYPSAENVSRFVEVQRPPGVISQFPGKNRTGQKFSPSVEPPRPVLSNPVWGNPTRPNNNNFNNTWFGPDQSPQNSRRNVSITRVDAQAANKTKSPSIISENVEGNNHFIRRVSVRPSVPPPGSGTRSNGLNNISESRGSDFDNMFPPLTRNINNVVAIKSNFPSSKKPPPFVATAQVFQGNSSARNIRPSPSPVTMTHISNDIYESPNFEESRMSLPFVQNNEDKNYITPPTSNPGPKRNRSPPFISSDRAQGISSIQDDSEREMQAKAKRLARFKVELSQPAESTAGFENQKSKLNKQNIGGTISADMDRDFDDTVLPDHEGPKSNTIITGLCPDMCPVTEREERERKGDLDRYERLDGDRNQTNKSLAVKKYNRTAERKASLIRPMPVLKKTIDYLLYLLDQPYDEKFLGLYNFLWDRMRAIRMDLRMQHLFNLDSITMLEQMIRLHIIAMHELCEYTKGEGFSEGFDAHLNIEQMNKTSVELFQLYDDHRKKGINVPTEKEFRGYYALLKLDKHPGYKVEPAELSHDLSKMTPEIRQTREVLFARDVARACRTGNFIAFFRLARKASYLQACLMHAHFSKLRTQALASLHSGLQNNQGIPVALIAKWLAMEGEDIESLLEYHGFLIREFDEPYMVKDGQFLNIDNDFPLKCSELVHIKKAEIISQDVSSSSLSTMSEAKEEPLIESRQECGPFVSVDYVYSISAVDEEMNDDDEVVPSPKSGLQVTPFLKIPSFGRKKENTDQMNHVNTPFLDFSTAVNSPKSPQISVKNTGKSPFSCAFRNSLERNNQVDTEAVPMQVLNQEKIETPRNYYTTENSVSEIVTEDIIEERENIDTDIQDIEPEEVDLVYDEEVAEAKLRLIFRIWRRHTLRRKELREQRQLAAIAALNSLSLGPPIRQSIDQPSGSRMLNIDLIANKRYERHRKSWSTLNISEIIADELIKRKLNSNCICWKMILCSRNQDSDSVSSSWLRSKLMPTKKDNDLNLITSSPNLSIWKKWVSDICYLSIVKEAEFDNLSETVLGSCAVLFLISEGYLLESERLRLHKIVSNLPSDSCLPLLIIVDSSEENSNSSILLADQLGLNNIEKSLIGGYSIIFLKKNQEYEDFDGFLSDEELRRGLKWLVNYSPLPPDIRCLKIWELIGGNLSSFIRVLDEIGAYEVGPDHCISAFNEALNRTINNIINAANANRCSCPCPEIDLIDKNSDEYKMVNLHLPFTGWSSSDRIDKIVSALKGTRLPVFEDDFSWIYKGSNSKTEVESQKKLLENCLIKYLAQTSKTMGISLATNEAHAMIQKNARLELHSNTYFIIPLWIEIFRRIFKWRLMGISTGDTSTAYVLDNEMEILLASDMEKVDDEDKSSAHDLIFPSLDEMIDRCTEIEVFRSPSFMVSDSSKDEKFNKFGADEKLEAANNGEIIDQISNETTSEMVVGSKPENKTGRLNELLEHCNILQDKIGKELFIYF